jgi:hypothetical protein
MLNIKKIKSEFIEELYKRNGNLNHINTEYEFLSLVYYVSTQHRKTNLTDKIAFYKEIDYYKSDRVQNFLK